MPQTEAQKRAQRKYSRRHVKRLTIGFYPKEHDLFYYLEQFDNRAGYVKELIRKDMQENKK